jgi:hypothetical protein
MLPDLRDTLLSASSPHEPKGQGISLYPYVPSSSLGPPVNISSQSLICMHTRYNRTPNAAPVLRVVCRDVPSGIIRPKFNLSFSRYSLPLLSQDID